MKFVRMFLIVVIALAAIGMIPGSVKAQKFSYTTGINVQNLSSGTATISIQFYNSGAVDGTGGSAVPGAVSDTITGFGVKSYFPLTAVAAGFNGSAVISSDQPVAAVTNITKPDFTALGAYNGSMSGNQTVYLPILHKGNGGWDSWYSIQNAGTAKATVNIDYSSNPAAIDKTVQVAPNASVTVAQATEAMHGTTKFFAATLSSDQPIVVVVLQENTENILAYTGFSNGSLLPVMPTINMNNSNFFTGTQIYNLGGAATDVTVSYSAAAMGSDCTETKTIPGKSMVVFTTSAFQDTTAGENCVSGVAFVGSGQVTVNSASQPLAVIVNQLQRRSGAPLYVFGSSYNGFDPAKATSTVFMPTIFDRNGTWYTAYNLINVSNGTAHVKCTYAGQPATTYFDTTGTGGLAAGDSITFTQLNKLNDRFIGSATCKTYTTNAFTTEDTSGKILTVVNQFNPRPPVNAWDVLLSYEGINP